MVESELSGRVMNRHIQDIHPMRADSRFVSHETGEEGWKKYMQDISLESTKELESEESQLEIVKDTGEALKRTDREARQYNQSKDLEWLAGDPKPALRRSRRLQKLEPEES